MVALALAALVGAHTLAWRFMAQLVEAEFMAWAQQRRAQGWLVAHGVPTRGGWPLSVTLHVPDLAIAGVVQALPGGVALQMEGVVLRASLPWVDTLDVDFHGTHRLRLGQFETQLRAARMTMQLPLAVGSLAREAELIADGLQAGVPGEGLSVSRLRLSIATSSTATETEAALNLVGEAEGILLPADGGGGASQAFGREIAALSVDASLTGPLPPPGAMIGRAEAWRDGGGTLELRSLNLRWGPVSAVTTATFALDEELQPMGAGSLRLAGAAQALGGLVEAGFIARRAAMAAQPMLQMLARPSAAGAPAEIDLPLTIEARTLAVARIPIVRLPALQWPQGHARPARD